MGQTNRPFVPFGALRGRNARYDAKNLALLMPFPAKPVNLGQDYWAVVRTG